MDTTRSETSVIEYEIAVGARPETVFSYFTDPARMVQWMGVEATLDPRPGGVCRIAFQPTESMAELLDSNFGGEQGQAPAGINPKNPPRVMMGEFVEVVPYRRITVTWGWERDLYAVPPRSTAVEVSFTPDGENTIVRLAHRRLPSTALALHQAGWQHYLPRLGVAASGGDPVHDPWQANPTVIEKR